MTSNGSHRVGQQTSTHFRTLSLLPSVNLRENNVIDYSHSTGKKKRPQLIHMYRTDPCDLLSSEFVHEFLDKNYFASSWNVSNSANERNLNTMWKGWFPSQDLVKFEEEEYPILIGVMIFPEDPGMNQYEILLCDDVLVWTNKELDLDCLLWDLIAFREEFQQNSYPLSQFVQKIVSCTELVLTICEYLSTNDAIATFSPDVLPLIFNNHKIFPLINPSRAFLLRMARTNNLEKMPHLSLSVDQLKLDSTTHERIIPWSVNPNLMLYSLNEPYFVNLTYLTISYAGQIEFIKLCRIFKIIPSCIKHLRLKFNSMECFNCSLKIVCVEQIPFNNGIETFELYLNSLSWSSWNNHCQESDRCLLNGLVELIAWMHHIQKIHLFLKEHIERLLYPAEWTSLLDRCRQLSEIKLQGKHNIESEMEFLNKVHNVTDELQHTRESMTFQVCVK